MILAALLAACTAAPLEPEDTRTFYEAARTWQRYWGYHEPPEETRRHVLTAKAACEAICPDQARELFMLYVSCVGEESDARWIKHGKTGWGTIALEPGEVCAAAKHLGRVAKTPTQRAALWARFRSDRTFHVWVNIRYLHSRVAESEGDWMTAMERHNGEKLYSAKILQRWYRTWLEPAPVWMVIR